MHFTFEVPEYKDIKDPIAYLEWSIADIHFWSISTNVYYEYFVNKAVDDTGTRDLLRIYF